MKYDRNTVVIINAENFFGVNLVKECLKRDMKVKAVVRDSSESSYLDQLNKAEQNLSIYESRLRNVDQLVDIFGNAAGLFFTPRDRSFAGLHADEAAAYARVINPSKEDLVTVLEAARKSKTIQRVVFNSSMSSVVFRGRAFDETVKVSGNDWSDTNFLRENHLWHHLMVTETEQCGWQFMTAPQQNTRFTFVTTHSGFIVGPLYPNVSADLLPSSILELLSIVKGEHDSLNDKNVPITDVRDLVDVDLMLYERWTLHGRFPVVSQSLSMNTLLQKIKKYEPSADIPANITLHAGAKAPIGRLVHVNCDTLESHGFSFRSVDDSLNDMFRSWRYHGVYEPSKTAQQ